MTRPGVLVIDGNRAATREQQVAAGGRPSGEGYAEVLQQLAPLDCDIVRPADGEVRLPDGVALADYDGVAITGSALNVYDGGAPIKRQLELASAVFDSGAPFFGSCWGLQVAVTVAGGPRRGKPPRGEIGFAARGPPHPGGRDHPIFGWKPPGFAGVTGAPDHHAPI